VAKELLLASQRVECAKLHGSGYQFKYSDIRSALLNILG
jgi:NAD dependent epimerase/dehydratase family enzyme